MIPVCKINQHFIGLQRFSASGGFIYRCKNYRIWIIFKIAGCLTQPCSASASTGRRRIPYWRNTGRCFMTSFMESMTRWRRKGYSGRTSLSSVRHPPSKRSLSRHAFTGLPVILRKLSCSRTGKGNPLPPCSPAKDLLRLRPLLSGPEPRRNSTN